MINHLTAINDHPTDTRRKVTATKRKVLYSLKFYEIVILVLDLNSSTFLRLRV